MASIAAITVREVATMEPGGYAITNCMTPTMTPVAFDQECAKIPEYRLSHGGRCGWTALAQASFLGNVPLIEHIVAKGEPELFYLTNSSSFTPLHCAVEAGHVKAARKLLDLGAPVNAKGQHGRTVLAIAATTKNVALTKLLLLNGAEAQETLHAEDEAIVAAARAEIEKDKKSASENLPECLLRELLPTIVGYTGSDIPLPEELLPDPQLPEGIVEAAEEPIDGVGCFYCSIM